MRSILMLLSIACAVGALGLSINGYQTVFDDSYSAKIVGGDAYNYIIYATRGTAIIGVGIVLAVLSASCGILAGLQPEKIIPTKD